MLLWQIPWKDKITWSLLTDPEKKQKSPELFRLIPWKDKNHLTCSDQFRWETKITWRVLTNPIERQKSPDLLWPILWTDKITWPVLTNPVERQKSPDLFWPIPLRDKNHLTCPDQSHRETKITWPVMTNSIERQKSPDLFWPILWKDKNHLTCSDQSCGLWQQLEGRSVGWNHCPQRWRCLLLSGSTLGHLWMIKANKCNTIRIDQFLSANYMLACRLFCTWIWLKMDMT